MEICDVESRRLSKVSLMHSFSFTRPVPFRAGVLILRLYIINKGLIYRLQDFISRDMTQVQPIKGGEYV